MPAGLRDADVGHSRAPAVGLVWGGNSGRAAVLPLRWVSTVAVPESPGRHTQAGAGVGRGGASRNAWRLSRVRPQE